MKKVTDYLMSLGLTKIEGEIYQGLLQTGPTTVKELSEFLRMKRITTHFNVESLIEKGLIIQTMHGARRKIMAEKPEHIHFLIERKESELKELRQNYPVIRNIINTIIPQTNTPKVEVKYYEGIKGVQLIYDDVLQAKQIRAYVNAMEVAKVFPNNMNMFIKTHTKRADMKIWEIMNRAPEVEKYAKKMTMGRYFYKFIPSSLNLSIVDYLIYDNKVAIINIRENPTGMIIINTDYYDNAKAIFDFVWEMLPS